MTNKKFKYAGSSNMSPIENTDRKEIRIKSKPSRIKEIVFLDGENEIKTNSAQQYVNLHRSNTFVDGAVVRNLDRLGNKPRLKVSFGKPGVYPFSVKCRPIAGNSRYSQEELARNTRFDYQKEQKSYSTESDGSLILPLDDFYVSAAGKDKFIFDATDSGGQTVSTGSLEVQRLIYYIEVRMRSLNSCAQSLSVAEREYAKHNIKLVKLPSAEMEYISNIDRNQGAFFLEKVEKAYSGSKAAKKEPYTIAVVYTSHLAVMKRNHKMLLRSVKVGPGSAPVLVDIVAQDDSSDIHESFHLWEKLDDEGWFVSARFIKDGGSRADIIQIPQDKCQTAPRKQGSQEAAQQVRIDVSALPSLTGSIELFVNVVDYMRGGMAYQGVNVICVCTMAWWKTIDEHVQNQVIVHELGHKIGMVPNGRGKGPDKPSTWYDDSKGHVGNHCFNGLPPNLANYAGDFDERQIKCVMYGASSNRSEFCANCSPIVCKVDISDGWEPL
jgi:hypothetical protein